MGGEERRRMERVRERDIVGSLSVCVGHMIRRCVCARAREFVCSFIGSIACNVVEKLCYASLSRPSHRFLLRGTSVLEIFSLFERFLRGMFDGTVWKSENS